MTPSSGTLDGRVVAITGGAAGIGRAVALAAAERGARLALIDRNETALELLRKELERLDARRRHFIMAADLTSDDQIRAFFETMHNQVGPPYALVNNVGGSFAYTEFKDLSVDEFDRTLALNLRVPFVCSREAVALMLATGEGSIVNMTSIAAERAIPAISAYSVAKAGVLAMTRSMAVELARSNIAVNAVSPGHVLTDTALRVVPPEIREQRDVVIPVGRHASPEDIAKAVLFLVADATYITGSVLTVDGGMTASMPRPIQIDH